MGEANKRGNFEQRKAMAIARNKVEAKKRLVRVEAKRKELAAQRAANPIASKDTWPSLPLAAALAVAMGGYTYQLRQTPFSRW